MLSKTGLTATPLAHRLVVNPYVFNLLFTSFVTKRFASQTRLLGADDWLFFNYGYEQDPPMDIPLSTEDEPHRFFIQLYHRTATQVDLTGKKVLEASCGHGGGASYLMRTCRPASYTGLDLNPAGIEFCQKRHRDIAGLDFVEGNAEELPFPDASFDAVLNVEASHLYPHFERFLGEVARVLTPGGHFLYTDFRRRQDVAAWEATLAGSPLRMVSQAVIDMDVLRGNEKNAPRKRDRISRHGPAIPRGFARFASDMTDWAFNGALRSGEFTYRVYCLTKD
ncbi:MAG TPA: class I SAM-dependent methyltransferase [Mycobacterium sp.]|nr:class I SAM-dependent methyltransferase [Mycobacterium sp.]